MKVFKNFKEVAQVRPGFSIEAIYGGALLGIAGADFIAFYDWTTATVGTSDCRHPAHPATSNHARSTAQRHHRIMCTQQPCPLCCTGPATLRIHSTHPARCH